MSDIFFDPDAVERVNQSVQSLRNQMIQVTRGVAGLSTDLQAALAAARRDTGTPGRQPNPWELWERHGFGRIKEQWSRTRADMEDIRGRTRSAIQQLWETQSRNLLVTLDVQSFPLDIALSHAIDGCWNAANQLGSNSIISLVGYPSAVLEACSQVAYWSRTAAEDFDRLLRFIGRLLAGESNLVALLQSGGGGLLPKAPLSPITDASGAATSNGEPTGAILWDYLSSKYQLSVNTGITTKGKEGRRNSEIGISADLSGDLWNADKRVDDKLIGFDAHHSTGITLGTLDASLGASASLGAPLKDGIQVGPSVDVTGADLSMEDVYGSKQIGLTEDETLKVLDAEGFAGIHDGSIGAEAGINFASAEEQVGLNIAGVNVGLVGEVGLKAEFGLEVGQKTELKLPFISIGFAFGEAK